jgi:hypothetical protein
MIGKAAKKVLIPLGVGIAVALAAGVKGAVDIVKGRGIRKVALKRFNDAISACEATRADTERVAREYGEFQILAHKRTVGHFADWLERNEHLVKRLNFKKIDGVRIEVPDVPKYVANSDNVTTGMTGLASAVGAGASAQAAALWGVSTFASASTGTAISTLSGAAAQNAILAWFGGGSLAAGGGGVAAGGAVLGLVSVVPVLLVGGMTMGIVGARTKTKAREYAATMELEIERIGLAQDLLGATDRRIEELRDLLGRMTERATHELAVLEALEFDPELHASEFLRVLQLVTAVKEVLNTPVLDPKSGELTETSIKIVRKYA